MGSPRIRARRALTTLLFFGLGGLGSPTAARAGSLYIETAGGISGASTPSPYFTTTDSSLSGMSFSVSSMANVTGFGATELHLGIQGRYALLSGTAGGSYTLMTAAPFVRLQLSRFSIGGGYTPLYYRTQTDETMAKADGWSYIGEVALLWPITKDFSLLASAVMQGVPPSGGGSAATLIEYHVAMRFYFGFWGGGGGGSGGGGASNEYRGWRYPFGKAINR